jgi:hypothetical protein
MSTPVGGRIPSTWAGGLTVGAQVFDHLRQPDEPLNRVAEADRVGRENRLPLVTECMVPVYSGMGLIRTGQVAEGMASLERGLVVWEGGGDLLGSPYSNRLRKKSVL